MADKDILTDKQESFAISYVFNGGDATAAYREHYNVKETTKETSIWCSASKLLSSPKVSQRVHELKMQKYSKKVLSIEERKEILSTLTTEGDLKAMEILNKMEGVYVERVEQVGIVVTRTIISNPTKDKSSTKK